MRRGTTPTLTFTTDMDLTQFSRVILTLKGSNQQIDLEAERLSVASDSLSCTLTQEETLRFKGSVEAQVRAISSEGTAVASDICKLDFKRILKEGVIDV